ncbi:MAG TPA: hypothetical protein VGK73_34295 [Polyangiaceae bacterium]
MHPIYSVDPTNPAFNPLTWYNLIGAAGCVFWVLAYLFILKRCFADKSYGLPLVAICLNFGWELLASFVFPNPVALWHLFDRAWLAIDVLLVYQLWRWGRAEQTIPEIARYFHAVVVVTFALGVWGQYAFVDSYRDRLGLVGAFGVNLIMSILFVFFYFARRESGRGLSRAGAVFKMLGTLGTSIECHWVVGSIDPELQTLAFLTFLCVTIFLFDCLYIYLVFTRPGAAVSR